MVCDDGPAATFECVAEEYAKSWRHYMEMQTGAMMERVLRLIGNGQAPVQEVLGQVAGLVSNRQG